MGINDVRRCQFRPTNQQQSDAAAACDRLAHTCTCAHTSTSQQQSNAAYLHAWDLHIPQSPLQRAYPRELSERQMHTAVHYAPQGPAYVYVSTRQHTSAHVSIRGRCILPLTTALKAHVSSVPCPHSSQHLSRFRV